MDADAARIRSPGSGSGVAPRVVSRRARRRRAGAVAAVVALLAVAAVACGRQLGESVDGHDVRSARTVASDDLGGATTPPAAIPASDPTADALVRDVDWRETTYLSACGLSRVRVAGGVGEATTVGPYYGVEVVDVSYADLDGDDATDAVVLVDCLGADSYQAHVLVVSATGVVRGTGEAGGVGGAVAPSSGGSLVARARPVSVSAEDGGAITVTVEEHGDPVRRELQFAPGVLQGGELTATPGTAVSGVLAAWDGTTATISVSPDDGYRLPAPAGLTVVDPTSGVPLDLPAMVGAPMRVSVGADGAVAAVELEATVGGA